ncbi:MAG: alpha/beta fold hydrolase, partial [Pseudomonadota bacterium]
FTALTVSTMSVAPDTVRRFLASTGSEIDAEGRAHYRRLIANPRHVDGTLRMMAAWNLDGLIARMPRNEARVVLLAAEKDGTVPPSVSEHAARRLPHARVVHLAGLGHLAHEEAPARIADQIFAALEGARAVSA